VGCKIRGKRWMKTTHEEGVKNLPHERGVRWMADYLGAIYDEVAVILSTTYEDFRD
jgi:hypothetical protein